MTRGWSISGSSAVSCRQARMHPRRASGGFSLIELLMVLVILIILTTIYWGSTSESRQRSSQKACQRNLQKIYMAMDIFSKDHADKFPEVIGARTSEEALDPLVPRYTVDTGVFICPGRKDPSLPDGESFLKRRISYAYYMGRRSSDSQEVLLSDRQVDTKSKAAGQDAFSSTGKPPGNNHARYGGNFLFCDGRVESSPVRVPFPLTLSQGIILLNPKP